jgi:hypothetical protein
LHATNRDIETITSETLQEKFIDRNLAVRHTTASRDVWLNDKVRGTIAGRAETGNAKYTSKALSYSPCRSDSPTRPNRFRLAKPDVVNIVADKNVTDSQIPIEAQSASFYRVTYAVFDID